MHAVAVIVSALNQLGIDRGLVRLDALDELFDLKHSRARRAWPAKKSNTLAPQRQSRLKKGHLEPVFTNHVDCVGSSLLLPYMSLRGRLRALSVVSSQVPVLRLRELRDAVDRPRGVRRRS